jgi:acyl carrier protein
VGELYIGGAGLARGYWGDPGKTAERFVMDPETGLRLYRTGDLGRWLPDGTIELLGRMDAQVKIQGYRVELGEIEAALVRHPDVAEAAAVARRTAPGALRLLAFVVAAEGRAPSEEALRAFLAERLPGYMVPSRVVPLPALPLTANGKVDRKALPDLESEPAGAEHPFEAPRSPTEEELVRVWAEVLGLDPARVSIHDRFLDAGGDSLLAIQLVSKVNEVFDVTLPLRRFFAAGTVAELAEVVEGLVLEEIAGMSDEEARELLDR